MVVIAQRKFTPSLERGSRVARAISAIDGGQDVIHHSVSRGEMTIIGKDIVYDTTRIGFPTSIPFDSSVIVSIWGQNNLSENVQPGIHWIVTDPDGQVAQEHSAWSSSLISPGGIHGFEGAPIIVDKTGDWNISVELLINPSSPIEADSYSGAFVTVIGGPEEFAGEIVDKRMIFDTQPCAFGSDLQIGTVVQVKIQGKNLMSTTQDMGCYWIIKNPLGFTVQEYSLDYWEWATVPPPNTLVAEFAGTQFTLNEEGTWSIEVRLLMNPADPVTVDIYQGRLVNVYKEVPPPPPIEKYTLVQHTEYPRGKTYTGKAERCTFDFKLYPEQIPGVTWLGKKTADAFANEVVKEGAEMLDLKVYEDVTPALWTNYRVIATATASPVPWAIIIVAVLAILFIVSLTFLIREIRTIDWSKPTTPLIFAGIGALAVVGLIMVAKRRG